MDNSRPAKEPRPVGCASRTRLSWPEGATAGILIVAAACLGVSATVYHIAGPRNVFAQEALTGR